MDTRTWRGERMLAGAVVVALHVVLAWCAMRASRLPHVATTDAALQVVYLPPPPARPTSRPMIRSVRRAPAAPRGAMQAQLLERDVPAAVPPRADLSPAALRRQLGTLPQADAPGAAVAPWQDRAATLPGRAGGRFRMRRQVSPADVVAGIGRLFYGGGEADPCPRNRRNITALQDGRDPAALQQELAFERRHCRP